MVTKPWSARTKTAQQLLMESDGVALEDSGSARHSDDAAGRCRAAVIFRSTS